MIGANLQLKSFLILGDLFEFLATKFLLFELMTFL